MPVLLFAGLAVLTLAGDVPALAQTVPVTPPEFKHLKYRCIGPWVGGRVCRVAGVPGDPRVYYAASAAGGVWKSVDGGGTWKPTTDEQSVSSIGSLALAPGNPNILYAGAGEANIRGDLVVGNGIYKSTDGGKHWQHVWKQEGQIGTIIVHPVDPSIVFAAVLGHAFGPNKERGVYRTVDGGKHWQRVLFKDNHTGASDVCFDPTNPQILFAALWQARREPWSLTSGGPGSGIYISRDGGETWKQLAPPAKDELEQGTPGKGLPKGPWGKIGVAVAPSDGRRVYALIEADKGGLYRSDDGGDSWTLASGDQNLRQRAWYYSTITVDPKNPDIVVCPQVSMLRSIDGGKTFGPFPVPNRGDHHDLWIDPHDPRRMINASDGGVAVTINGGENWATPHLPIAQFYHVAADNHIPYRVCGAMQDLGTASGPSNSLAFGGIGRGDWINIGGGESGFAVPDPSNPDIIYAGSYGGYISRFDWKTRQVQNVSIYPLPAVGRGGAELRYRFQWTSPILVSPHNAKLVYHASNVLFETRDGGKHWRAISPDLTRNDKIKQQWTGGPITGDNTGAEIYCTIFALAESPKQPGLLWVGSDDGLVHISQDGGKQWRNVTSHITGLPEWGTISCIEPSPFEAGTAYVVVDAHRLDNMRPYLFKTTDFGMTWKNLASRLPQDQYLHAVRADPKQHGLLFLATDEGVLFSRDDGANWQALKLNLPTVPVHDLVVKDNDLIVATHGRSLWIFEDLTPIRLASARVTGQKAALYPIGEAIRWRYDGGNFADAEAPNPPQGAVVDYWLKEKPKGDVTLKILDSRGSQIAFLTSKVDPQDPGQRQGSRRRSSHAPLTKETGVNRITWDLTYTGPTTIPGAMAWPPGPQNGPLVNPGTYTVKLEVDGKTCSESVVVRADPRAHVSQSDLAEQLKVALALRDDITRLAKMVQEIRSLKKQLTAKKELWDDAPNAKGLVKTAQVLIDKLDSLEGKLHNPKAKIMYDLLAQRGGAQLYSQFSNLYFAVQGSDNAPTQGILDLYREEEQQLAQLDTEFKKLAADGIVGINHLARKLGIPDIITASAEVKEKQKSESLR
jgi:photosystem II stability/assembly factor-like uncharacterized protein